MPPSMTEMQLGTAPAGSGAGSISQNPLLGGVPSDKPVPGTLSLSLEEAVHRGLRQNLALLLQEQDVRSTQGERLRALSDLLPHLSAYTEESAQQINLAAFGLPVTAFPGVKPIVGPFGLFDARANYSQRLFDWKAIQKQRSADESVRAAQYSYRDVRELVVLVVANLYLQSLAGRSRVETARAQFATAKAVYEQTTDLKKAGLAAGIDVLRAQVEMQAQQQRVLAAENELEKEKLALARSIGLAPGQEFELSDAIPYAPAPEVTLEAAEQAAFQQRADYQQAVSLARAAELARKSEAAGHLPSLRFDGDYGTIGLTPGNSHGTFTAAGKLEIPIFQGGRVRGDVVEADATLRQRQAQLGDLRGRIDAEIRTALLDMATTAQQVEVARSSVGLANQQLTEARDRLRTGVADTLEVVQAQESVASANETYISSLYALNLAKTALARAMGQLESGLKGFLEGKP